MRELSIDDAPKKAAIQGKALNEFYPFFVNVDMKQLYTKILTRTMIPPIPKKRDGLYKYLSIRSWRDPTHGMGKREESTHQQQQQGYQRNRSREGHWKACGMVQSCQAGEDPSWMRTLCVGVVGGQKAAAGPCSTHAERDNHLLPILRSSIYLSPMASQFTYPSYQQ